MSILHAVAEHYCLSSLCTVHEFCEDGSHLYGIEVELPAFLCSAAARRLFCWTPPGLHSEVAYEAAALEALTALQSIFGFAILDYSFHGLVLYRTLAQRLLPVANSGIQLTTQRHEISSYKM